VKEHSEQPSQRRFQQPLGCHIEGLSECGRGRTELAAWLREESPENELVEKGSGLQRVRWSG
jgi:hypothetical protein